MFVRSKKEERTGFQNGLPPADCIDCQCDFVMVYRFDASTRDRIRAYSERGYVIHLMTGISWGHYTDYLDGEYDGRTHWDEAQTDRFGNQILHGPLVPYMVPTVSFCDYLTEQLKKAVDLGVEAIHVEEPEFWDRAGYSDAFKREYALYYREPWQPPHESVDARYRCAKLKAYLFTRAIDRISSALKEYASVTYGRTLRFYVPTHSLINYTQWKIVSPEGKLADIPAVDGCIAQVWTGTSREKNWFNGEYKERTFETAFLEYGVMQELVKGTGRHMWFLHDPIEDNPAFDWNDYRKNYLCTVAASLLHPKVNTYEICPWPNRIFTEKYPRNDPAGTPIPAEYATLLNNTFQTLGTLESGTETAGTRVGILTGDSQLCQRAYPDSEFSEKPEEITGTVLIDSEQLLNSFREKLFPNGETERETMLKYMESSAFPAFYSLALPLLKYGVPIRPVLADNLRRYAGYLDDYDVLVVSYEYMKPDFPDVNAAIAEWVKKGGTLIYVGNGFDPYNRVNSWWSDQYQTPADHLFAMLGIAPEKKGVCPCGSGTAGVWETNPCLFSFSKENADGFRQFFTDTLAAAGKTVDFRNSLSIARPPYLIASVMDESVSDEPLTFTGLYVDMFSPAFDVLTEKTICPGEHAMLCDLSYFDASVPQVIGTSVRINAIETENGGVSLKISGAGDFTAHIRILLPFVPRTALIDGVPCDLTYDSPSRTALLTFAGRTGERTIIIR